MISLSSFAEFRKIYWITFKWEVNGKTLIQKDLKFENIMYFNGVCFKEIERLVSIILSAVSKDNLTETWLFWGWIFSKIKNYFLSIFWFLNSFLICSIILSTSLNRSSEILGFSSSSMIFFSCSSFIFNTKIYLFKSLFIK